MTAARTLTHEQSRRLTLALQHISVPAQGPLDVVRRLTAIQTQYAASLPGALWTRTPNVTTAWVDEALNGSRTLVKVWTIRGTLHAIASEDYSIHIGGYCQQWLPGMIGRFRRELGITPDEAEKIFQSMVGALAGGPLSRTELHERVPDLKRLPGIGWGHDLKALVFRGDVVFAESRTSTAPRFALREQWLPHVQFEMPDLADARVELIRRYLRGHAPANPRDVHYWLGIYLKDLKLVWSSIEPELIPLTIEGQRGAFYIHQDDLPVLDALPDAPPVSLLPKFDAFTLAHRGSDRSRLVDKAHSKRIFGAAGQVEALVLLDGEVAGTWRYKTTARKLSVTVAPFGKLKKPEAARIVREAERFGAWNGYPSVEVSFTP